jgi:protein-L-isoaspartate(D-aspartate) O-methyltransferase
VLKDKLKPGMRALDVGSGSGYLTACMALMLGPSGKVVGIGTHELARL